MECPVLIQLPHQNRAFLYVRKGTEMKKKNAVICNLNREKYHPVIVGISRQGKWFYFTGDVSKIKKDTWCNGKDCIPAVLSPDRTEHELLVLKGNEIERI